MKMFTTIAVATVFLGLAACTKNEPAPIPVEPVAEEAVEAAEAAADVVVAVEAAEAEATGVSAKSVEGAPVQPK